MNRHPQPSADRPLSGRKILVTRAREQAAALSDLIRQAGGEPVELPTIRIRQPDDWSEVDRAIRALASFDWVVFTSTNGVKLWMMRMAELGAGRELLKGVKLAAIGPATARELEKVGLTADLVPAEYVAEVVLEDLLAEGVEGKRLLLPRAAEARPLLARGLEEAGAQVTELPLYNTVGDDGDTDTVVSLLEDGRIDAVTFTSSSTVRSFARMMPEGCAAALLRGARVVCIGPVTAATARELGLHVDSEAAEHTMPGLVEALEQEFRQGTVSA